MKHTKPVRVIWLFLATILLITICTTCTFRAGEQTSPVEQIPLLEISSSDVMSVETLSRDVTMEPVVEAGWEADAFEWKTVFESVIFDHVMNMEDYIKEQFPEEYETSDGLSGISVTIADIDLDSIPEMIITYEIFGQFNGIGYFLYKANNVAGPAQLLSVSTEFEPFTYLVDLGTYCGRLSNLYQYQNERNQGVAVRHQVYNKSFRTCGEKLTDVNGEELFSTEVPDALQEDDIYDYLQTELDQFLSSEGMLLTQLPLLCSTTIYPGNSDYEYVPSFYAYGISLMKLSDEELQNQIDHYFQMGLDEFVEKNGTNYHVVPSGAEGVENGLRYDHLGLTFTFIDDTLEWIDCDQSFRIFGAGKGMSFSEITALLGKADIQNSFMETPDHPVLIMEYRLGNSLYSFVSIDGDDSWLTIYQG